MTQKLTHDEITALLRLVVNEKVKNPKFTDELTVIEVKLVNLLNNGSCAINNLEVTVNA